MTHCVFPIEMVCCMLKSFWFSKQSSKALKSWPINWQSSLWADRLIRSKKTVKAATSRQFGYRVIILAVVLVAKYSKIVRTLSWRFNIMFFRWRQLYPKIFEETGSYTEQEERIVNFLNVPLQLEKLVLFGNLICLDSLLIQVWRVWLAWRLQSNVLQLIEQVFFQVLGVPMGAAWLSRYLT